jgi:hypothetical protein
MLTNTLVYIAYPSLTNKLDCLYFTQLLFASMAVAYQSRALYVKAL